MYQQMPAVIHLRREEWQVALCRPLGNLAVRIEGGAMAVAIKRTVLLRIEFAFFVGAYGRQRKQFAISPDHKKSQSAEPVMDPFLGIITNRSRIHDAFRRYCIGHGGAGAGAERASGTPDTGQPQKPSPSQVHFALAFVFHGSDQYSNTRLRMKPDATPWRAS